MLAWTVLLASAFIRDGPAAGSDLPVIVREQWPRPARCAGRWRAGGRAAGYAAAHTFGVARHPSRRARRAPSSGPRRRGLRTRRGRAHRYLGLDPRVRQSGAGPATHGHISKQGSVSARHALVEACWSTVRQPGPIAAFYQRIKARRGHSIAIVASARKLACLFWCLLTRGEDYAFAQPSLTKKKMRRLELQAGAAKFQGGRGVWSTNERTVKDWQPQKGASATPGRASRGRLVDRWVHSLRRRHPHPAILVLLGALAVVLAFVSDRGEGIWETVWTWLSQLP